MTTAIASRAMLSCFITINTQTSSCHEYIFMHLSLETIRRICLFEFAEQTARKIVRFRIIMEQNIWQWADCGVCEVKETFLLRSSVSSWWRQLARCSAALREATSRNNCCCNCACASLATMTSVHGRTSLDDVMLSLNTCLYCNHHFVCYDIQYL